MPRIVPFPSKHAKNAEWLGGRYSLPVRVHDGDRPFRPGALLWLELPSGLLVGTTLTHPSQQESLAQSLRDTMKKPMEGPPRRPSRIRVADRRTADELREAAAGIPIVVEPVPELDAAFELLSNALGALEPEPSYVDDTDVQPRVVGGLFAAADLLFRSAPWRRVSDAQVLRVDIPRFGIDGACLSVIGASDTSFGLMLFQSLDDYEAFLDAAERGAPPPGAPDRLAFRSLSFDRKKDIPQSLLREIEKYRWPVAGAKAYPVLLCVGADLEPRPATDEDFRIMTAVARAFLAFFARHAELFEHDDPDPVSETGEGEDGLEVTITAPFFLYEDEVPASAPPSTAKVGRNDPCPCGSGKKYKKCHLEADQAPRRTASETVHEMDYRMIGDIGRFASRRFGPDWLAFDPEDEDEDALQLLIALSMWTGDALDESVSLAYRLERETVLSAEEVDWIDAQRRAWLSVWEVTDVEAGRIAVRDLLTGETRSVREELASQTLVMRDAVLARVVDYRGDSYFGGMYPRSLPPRAAAAVVESARRSLRRKTAVPPDRLRDRKIGWLLVDHWGAELARADERRATPPALHNTDGDPLLFVIDSYAFDAGLRAEIDSRIAAMRGVDRIAEENAERMYTFLRGSDDIVIGRVAVGAGVLRIETNSEVRAKALAKRVEKACDGMLRPGSRKTRAALGPHAVEKEPAESSPEQNAFVREYKEQHYRKWLDHPVPALEGKTPRAAARSAKSRVQLDLLLRDLEHGESLLPEAERFDVSVLRRELGLD